MLFEIPDKRKIWPVFLTKSAGYIATEMTDQLTDKVKEEIINRIPLGYIGNTNNVATAALFLASDEAGYITGQTISVDGGMLIN